MIKTLFLALLLVLPLRQVVDLQLAIPIQYHEIFPDYQNDNFSQKIYFNSSNNGITASIRNYDYHTLNLDFRIIPDRQYIASLSPELQHTVEDLFDGRMMFKPYFQNVSNFLANHISYSEEELPQDAAAVILNKKAYCVGYSNLVKVFLEAVSIKSRVVKGFYLERSKKKRGRRTLIPIPHRWVEVCLSRDLKFFYDPQYQRFSEYYITTHSDIDFTQIRRFTVNVIKKSKKIIN